MSFSPAWITYTAIHHLRKTGVRDIAGPESVPTIKKPWGCYHYGRWRKGQQIWTGTER